MNMLKSCLLVLGSLFATSSFAAVIVDVVEVNQFLSASDEDASNDSASWTHDINDNGFTLGSALFGTILIDFSDDASDSGMGERNLEFGQITIEITDFILGDDIGLWNAAFDFGAGLSGTSIISLNADGLLDVFVESVWGDFNIGDSTLTVITSDPVVTPPAPVPEPASLALLGLGLLGLGVARRKAKA